MSQPTVRVNAYEVMRRAVEAGIAGGWARAHKHTEAPDPERLRVALVESVMDEICAAFEFPPRAEMRGV